MRFATSRGWRGRGAPAAAPVVVAGLARSSTIVSRFLDTNVLVYAIDDDEPGRKAKALSLLESTPDFELALSAQVLGEFFVVATRKLPRPWPVDEARAMVDELRRLHVVPVDGSLVSAAIDGSAEWGISYLDALIMRAAEAAGCDVVLSEDLGHGRMYGSVTVEDPFR